MSDKEISKTTDKDVKKTKKSESKKISSSKLPGLFKKTYTEEKFQKSVIRKIFIDTDQKLVEKQFKKITDSKGNEVYAIDKTAMISKEDFNRCKAIAKEVKSQKVGVKFIPLLAVVCLIALIGVSVTLFKNVVVARVLCNTMQGFFGAKTDVEKVDLQIFGASLEIDGLAQANPDSPMKNIFQIDRIHVDFNLSDLLRGKFHAENIEVSGVAIGTDRTKSGEILGSSKSKHEQAVENAFKTASDNLASAASDQLKAMFENYNPEKMLDNLQNELKSPSVANDIYKDVQQKVTKWQNVPAEYQASVTKLSTSVDKLIKTDWGRITNASTLKSTLENIESAITETKKLQKQVGTTTNDIKVDSNTVKTYSDQLQGAINADKKLVDSKISEMKSLFSPAGLKQVMVDAVKSVLYQKAGKYYPYVDKAMNAALSSKGSGSEKTAEQKQADAEKEAKKAEKVAKAEKKAAKKEGHGRSAGRMVYYRKDTVPKLLIENVKASGYEYKTDKLLFEGTASEISSDQNMRGKPSVVSAKFNVQGKPNTADVTIDARDSSSAPLVNAKYFGSGYPISADAQVFELSSDSDIDAVLTADDSGSFTVSGKLNMKVKEMKGMEFEPAKVSDLYGKAVSGISSLTVGFKIGYSKGGDITVEITDTDKLAKQLVDPVTKALTGELNAIANDARANVTKMLSEKTGIASEQIEKFTDISGALNGQLKTLNDLQAQLEKKKKEVAKQIASTASDAAMDTAKKALKSFF